MTQRRPSWKSLSWILILVVALLVSACAVPVAPVAPSGDAATAAPAEAGPPTVRSTTGAAVSVDALLVRSQQALDLSELGVRLLQHRGTTLQNVEAEVVADSHLVTQATEIPGESGHSLGQLLTPLV